MINKGNAEHSNDAAATCMFYKTSLPDVRVEISWEGPRQGSFWPRLEKPPPGRTGRRLSPCRRAMEASRARMARGDCPCEIRQGALGVGSPTACTQYLGTQAAAQIVGHYK